MPRSAGIGRSRWVGVVVDGQPLIFPVNYVLDGQFVVVHTDIGPMLSGTSQARLALEVDSFDAVARSGWSVSFRVWRRSDGRARLRLRAPADRRTLTWAPGPKPRLLRISATMVTGRRFQGATPAA
ncbi:MAG: pyridoxamine 5'-phosphate oxidase family protein [Acidimicrobiales bacterium]